MECPHPHETVNFTSIVVTIGSVQVHRSGALNLTGEWITVTNAPKTFDILQLKNVVQLLGSTKISEGTITIVRLNVTSTVATTSQLKSVPLVLSSGKLEVQPGSNVEVRSGMTTQVTVDFQPHVVCEGNGTFRLTPVLVATAQRIQ